MPAAALAAAAVVGAVVASKGAKSAANTQANAANNAAALQASSGAAALAEQQRQFDTTLGLGANQRFIGNQALNALGEGFGFSPAPGYGADYSPNTGVVTLQQQQQQQDQQQATTQAAIAGLSVPKSIYGSGGGRPIYLPPSQGGLQSNSMPSGTGLPMRFQQISGGSNLTQAGNAFLPAGSGPPSSGMFTVNPDIPQAPTNDYGANQFAPQTIAPGDYSKFFASPDYQFRQQEGLNIVENSAAAHGGLYSGDTLRGITDYSSNLAAGEYGNYFARQRQLFGEEEGRRANDFARNQGVFADQQGIFADQQGLQQDQFNRLATIAGIGSAATSQASQAAIATGANASNTLQNTASNQGNAFLAAGNAQAQGQLGQASAISSGIGNLAGLYALYSRQPASQTSQTNQVPYYLGGPQTAQNPYYLNSPQYFPARP